MKYLLITVVICMSYMQSGCIYQKNPTQESPTAVSSEPASSAPSECQAITRDIDKAAKRLYELELLSNSKQCH